MKQPYSIKLEEDIINEADYIIDNFSTIRDAADYFGKSKSCIHNHMIRLKELNFNKYQKVKKVLDYNFNVKHLRGGNSTSIKFKNK